MQQIKDAEADKRGGEHSTKGTKGGIPQWTVDGEQKHAKLVSHISPSFHWEDI